jgi:hypothetical protein
MMMGAIGGIKLCVLAYAWSQQIISYFLSTCGSTAPSSVLHQRNFKDEFGYLDYKMSPCPQLCHFLYEYIPLIVEHNKQFQYVLQLEKKLPTKDC